MNTLQSVSDYEQAAESVLSPGLFDYIQKRAGAGKAFDANLKAFTKYQIVPRVLSGGSNIDLTTRVLDRVIATPMMVAPTAWHKMFCQQGEAATSRAAKISGIPYVISSFSTLDFSEIDTELSHTWYQILMYKDKELMKRYIQKSERAGCSAIVITIDAPSGCSMCKSFGTARPVKFPIHELPLFPTDPNIPYATLDEYYPKYMDPSFGWDDIKQVMAFTKLPVILKGILHPEDAKRAVGIGVAGIVVSNHGGRQFDDAIASLDALALIPSEVKQAIDVYLDSGIRTGVDIFKALALGAKAVLVGRPILYGMSVAGEDGVLAILHILDRELRECMRATGCKKISDISSDLITKSFP